MNERTQLARYWPSGREIHLSLEGKHIRAGTRWIIRHPDGHEDRVATFARALEWVQVCEDDERRRGEQDEW